MALSAQQKSLVQMSFASLALKVDDLGMRFYERLFVLDPSLRPLFKGDIKEQSSKLIQMIAVAVGSLDQEDVLIPAVQDLGKRHVAYGVKKADYDTVGKALIETLQETLGDEFTPELREAWMAVFALLAQVATQVYDGHEET